MRPRPMPRPGPLSPGYDGPMEEPTTSATADPVQDPKPGSAPSPGERRLERPPSDRYRAAEPTAADGDAADAAAASGAAPGRGIALGLLVAIVLAAAITVAGGILLVSAGLVVLAAAGGWAVALALKIGPGATMARRDRIWLAAGLALAAVVLGQVGLWLFARTEGGVLPLVDYLFQTFGPLVPLQALAAAGAAAWSAR